MRLSQENNVKLTYSLRVKKAIILLNDNVCSFFFCTLCLNGVEEGELVLVECLKSRVSEGSDRQWLQVQQLSGWGVLLR